MLVLNDFQTSVAKALGEIDPKWRDYEGLIICGTHAPHDVEHMIDKITEARKKKIPYLGICFGHQLAAIEFARTVQHIEDATSEEWAVDGTPVVKKRSELKVGLHDGETYWSHYDVAINWNKPSWFFTTPYHPEYNSMPGREHPVLVEFLNYARGYEMAV